MRSMQNWWRHASLGAGLALGLAACTPVDEDGSSQGSATDSAGTDAGGTDSGGDTEVDPDPIDPGETGAPDEPVDPDLYDGGAYWRIGIAKTFSTNTLAIGEVVRVDIAAGEHDPVPSVGGDYLVVAYAGDAVVSAQPLHFASAGRMEAELEGGGMVLDVIMIDESPAVVFIPFDEAVTRVTVEDGMGAVVAEIGGDALPTMSFRSYDNPISDKYPHIEVLGAADGTRIPQAYYNEAKVETVLDPTPEQYVAILQGLDKLAPGVRAAITTIAVVEPPNKGCVSVGTGGGTGCGYDENGNAKVIPFCASEGLVQNDADGNALPTGMISGGAIGSYQVLNTHTYPWTSTVIHEGGHNFNNLVDGSQLDAAAWTPAQLAEARKLVRDYRLAGNLTQTWYDLHHSAYQADPDGVGEMPPPGQELTNWCSIDDQAAVDAGFATPYGWSNVYDDIAEHIGQVAAHGPAARVCAQFTGQSGGEFPEHLAVPFAKLALLRQIGAITTQQFDACVQGVQIGRTSEGIELGDQVFTSELKAGYYEGEGTRYFAILGQGVEQWQLLYEASVEEGESPLGVHKFGSISGLSLALFGIPANGVYLNHPDTPRASDFGLLFITEASSTRVTGAVFHLTLQNAFGQNTSYDAYAPFLIGAPP
jgi:hypothetical protein